MLQLSKLSPSVQGSMVAPLVPWDKFSPECFLMTVKGAPEVLLPFCSYVLSPNGGAPIRISDEGKERIAAVQDR
jgi:sodium/potassium-transporting ATPase subunit alpha